jgi:hypothetical protein
MGQYHSDGDAVVQRIHMAAGGFGGTAYWNGHVFFASDNDYLRDYAVKDGQLVVNKYSSTKFANPGAPPTFPRTAKKMRFIWALATKTWNGQDQPAVFYAFDANDISHPYSPEQNSKRAPPLSRPGSSYPLVNDQVYFGARGEVEVYGRLQ